MSEEGRGGEREGDEHVVRVHDIVLLSSGRHTSFFVPLTTYMETLDCLPRNNRCTDLDVHSTKKLRRLHI